MDAVKNFTEKLILGLVKNKDIVKIQEFEDEDGNVILDIIVHSDDMGTIIGKSGSTIKAVRTLVNACAYKQNLPKIKVNVDSI
ncbi:MAG: KH domain-containing protein [Bacilli bacterium]|nr:KH domain-containing protein [Bacilli bacterium]